MLAPRAFLVLPRAFACSGLLVRLAVHFALRAAAVRRCAVSLAVSDAAAHTCPQVVQMRIVCVADIEGEFVDGKGSCPAWYKDLGGRDKKMKLRVTHSSRVATDRCCSFGFHAHSSFVCTLPSV